MVIFDADDRALRRGIDGPTVTWLGATWTIWNGARAIPMINTYDEPLDDSAREQAYHPHLEYRSADPP
jgi:hypothetical protein